jgi:hypothetical protein
VPEVATFDFEGREIRVIPVREMELGDFAFVKREFGIDGGVAFEAGLEALEVDAVRALLINSVRRVVPDVTADHPGVDGVNLVELSEQLNADSAAHQEAKRKEQEKRTSRGGRARPTAGKRS